MTNKGPPKRTMTNIMVGVLDDSPISNKNKSSIRDVDTQSKNSSDLASGVSNQIIKLDTGSPEDSDVNSDDYSSTSLDRSLSSDPTEELNLNNKLEVELCTLQKG